MPHSVAARADELYFCVKRAVLDENRYASDLWVLRDGKARRLTTAGDVSGFWLTDEGVVFSALREKKDKERAEAGEPLTVLYVLPYDGGEAREFCRLDCSVGEVRFLGNGRFLFTATVSRDWERALSEAGGDAKSTFSLKRAFPMFVLFFVLASVITTVLQLPVSITAPIKELSKFFIVMAMAAIGFNTDIVELVKKGGKPIALGFFFWIGIACMSLGMQHVLGIW